MSCAGKKGTRVENSSDNYILADFDITEEDTKMKLFFIFKYIKIPKKVKMVKKKQLKKPLKENVKLKLMEK